MSTYDQKNEEIRLRIARLQRDLLADRARLLSLSADITAMRSGRLPEAALASMLVFVAFNPKG